MSLRVVPIGWRTACAFITLHHRHHKQPRGQKLAIGIQNSQALVGVATMGRPNARAWDDGTMAEVTRTCTDGTRNANSMLYGAMRRVALAMGYECLITYTQAGESGASLLAAGWRHVRHVKARKNWANSSSGKHLRLRDKTAPEYVDRELWEAWPSGRFPKDNAKRPEIALSLGHEGCDLRQGFDRG
jgi:hypothetical protein